MTLKCRDFREQLNCAVHAVNDIIFRDFFPSFSFFPLLPFRISDRFVTSQHALQENITQFEQQAITQQPFDQQGLSQG